MRRIAEIVSILEADPATDWTKVDLSALRQHLVDMNRLTLDANTDEVSLEDGLAITITVSIEPLRPFTAWCQLMRRSWI